MKTVNTACRIAFELTFVLFVVLLIITPIHARSTRHLTVVQSLDATHAVIEGDTTGLEAGASVPLYRFNSDWEAPIGPATIESVSSSSAHIAVDPAQMSWPLGRSGVVSQDSAGVAHVALGTNQDIGDGSILHLYRDRTNVGEAHVVKAGPESSEIQLPIGIGDTSGLTASEFVFATQAVVYSNSLLNVFEVALIVLFAAAYCALYLRWRRSPFISLGEKLYRIRFPRTAIRWTVNILAGIPFVWFMGAMPLYLAAYIVSYVSERAFGHFVSFYLPIHAALPYAYALVALAYYLYLARYRRSPILAFWRFISYKGRSTVGRVTFARGIVLWTLHLAIVYAFGSALWNFFIGDLHAALSFGFPAPNTQALFMQLKFFIWALTVVGVLIGYGYSVISILWGSYIRNLDFTVTGWLTNGFCYPLFGVVIWQMVPGFTGIDPIIAGGPAEWLLLSLGLLFNVLYMLSIFNLGFLFDLMTDKGVRRSGFYSVIRHPNYMLESCMFFTTAIVGLTTGLQLLGILVYFFLYWIRSEREDNFMEYSNPEYSEYQKATPYKFLPGIY